MTVIAIVLAFIAGAAVLAQRDALIDNVDDRLRQRADDIAALVAGGSTPATLAVGDDDALAQLVRADTVVAASENAFGSPIVAASPPGDAELLATVDGLAVDDGEFRLLSRPFEEAGTRYVVHVAAALDDVHESVGLLTTTLAVALTMVVVVVAAVLWTVVGRALRRVEAAHNRLEQFVADASHELRSPLTSIRSELEVDLAHADKADLRTTHRSVLEDTVRLQRLVDGLLFLARHDNGTAQIRHELVNLDEVVLRETSALRGRGRTVDTTQVSGAQVVGDAELLSRATRNVLDNAVRHAASTVTVTLCETTDWAVLSIADDGPGIPPDHVTRIFERFTRVDDARDRGRGGAGLGLAITHDIVGQHNGMIAVEPDGSTQARFVIRLPLSSADVG